MPADETSSIPGRLLPIIPLLAAAKTNSEMADTLALTLHTIEKYVSELKSLLETRDLVALVDECRRLLDCIER